MDTISICICTFRRRELLQRTLESIARLGLEDFLIEIIVVDNDAQETAKDVVLQFGCAGLPVRYVVEPTRNIALARNRSVHEAAGQFIAFLDDDEEAHPDWLASLYRECRAPGVDGAFGPVIPRFDQLSPMWIVDSGLFDRPRPPTGSLVPWFRARTGNGLVRRAPLLGQPGPFDESFGLTGGEDTDLFRRMIASGAKFVAVDDALVFEHITLSRARAGYLIRRWYRIGGILARFELPERSGVARLWYVCESVYRVIVRTLLGVLLLPASKTASLRTGLLPAARAAGKLTYIFGRRPQTFAIYGRQST